MNGVEVSSVVIIKTHILYFSLFYQYIIVIGNRLPFTFKLMTNKLTNHGGCCLKIIITGNTEIMLQ
jgi:hypothetical protein